MLDFFHSHALVEFQRNEDANEIYDKNLTPLFPQSLYLLCQKALSLYHLRGFIPSIDSFFFFTLLTFFIFIFIFKRN